MFNIISPQSVCECMGSRLKVEILSRKGTNDDSSDPPFYSTHFSVLTFFKLRQSLEFDNFTNHSIFFGFTLKRVIDRWMLHAVPALSALWHNIRRLQLIVLNYDDHSLSAFSRNVTT